jgi:hypothetical protein
MRRLVLVALVSLVVAPAASAWTWPVRGPVLQAFDFDRAHPYGAGQHRGIAIGAGPGAAVVAPATGIVSFSGTVPNSGHALTIRTEDGLAVTLTLLGSLQVTRGSVVSEGDEVATAGQDPVHLGIREADDDQGYLDPLGFLPAPEPRAPTTSPAPTSSPVPSPAPAPVSAPAAAPVSPSAPAAAPAPGPVPAEPAPSPAPLEAPVAPASVAGNPSQASAHGRALQDGLRVASRAAPDTHGGVLSRIPEPERTFAAEASRTAPLQPAQAGDAPSAVPRHEPGSSRHPMARVVRSAAPPQAPRPSAGKPERLSSAPQVASPARSDRPVWQLLVGILSSLAAATVAAVALLRVPAVRRRRLAT